MRVTTRGVRNPYVGRNMFTNSDATVAIRPAEDDPFSYGDQTVLQLRTQRFDVQEEFGTVVLMPVPEPEDPMARMEQKLDLALKQIAALQQRLESLDVTLARVLSR
jgi:hypothetical protein